MNPNDLEHPSGASLAIHPVIVTILIKQVHILEPFLKGALLFKEFKNFVLTKLLLHNITPISMLIVLGIKGAALILKNAFTLIAIFALDSMIHHGKLYILFYFLVVLLEVSEENIVPAVSCCQEKSYLALP